jgi:hypothetical protein
MSAQYVVESLPQNSPSADGFTFKVIDASVKSRIVLSVRRHGSDGAVLYTISGPQELKDGICAIDRSFAMNSEFISRSAWRTFVVTAPDSDAAIGTLEEIRELWMLARHGEFDRAMAAQLMEGIDIEEPDEWEGGAWQEDAVQDSEGTELDDYDGGDDGALCVVA